MKKLFLLVLIGLIVCWKGGIYEKGPRLFDIQLLRKVPVTKATKSVTKLDVESAIQEVFLEAGASAAWNARLVAKAESGFNPTAKNWNCMYDGVSTSCKKEDRSKAWSVDCGTFQINVRGLDCPAHLLDYKQNIKLAYELFKRRGLQPWVAARKLGLL